MAGIYFHIPFCKRICSYCDFPRTGDLRLLQSVLKAMHDELESRAGYLAGAPVRTLYFGGGTPSLCTPEALQELIDHARSLLGFGPLEEITVECNPDDLTEAYVARLRETEIDRVSVGVQSFDDGCLRLMNRRHTAAEAIEAVRRLQRAGFRNLTIDLIFGVPGYGGEILRRTLETALSLNVPHISAYHLTVEPHTALGHLAARGAFRPVEEEASEEAFAVVHDTLTTHGYAHYEVSNYALPHYRARHNGAYWTGEPYLGIGPGAHSFNGTERCWCEPDVAAYATCPRYERETLSLRDRHNETLMTGLRTSDGIDLDAFGMRFGQTRLEKLLLEARSFLAEGTLRCDGRRLRIPPERFLISDAVIAALFEAY